ARPAAPHRRRALPRAGSHRRRAPPRHDRRPPPGRPHDADRRAVPQRGDGLRRAGGVHGEGRGALLRPDPAARRRRRPRAGRLPRRGGHLMPDLALRFDLLVLGLMSGLGYGLLATGLVLVYRATRVINLAHGQIGAFAAVVLLELVHTVGLPYPLALPLSFAAGAVVALAVERLVVRPLVDRSRLAVLVATIGVIQVLLVGQLLMPDIVGKGFPVPVEVQWEVASVVIRGEHLAL